MIGCDFVTRGQVNSQLLFVLNTRANGSFKIYLDFAIHQGCEDFGVNSNLSVSDRNIFLIFIKVMEFIAKNLEYFSSFLKNIDTQIKHGTPMVLVIASLVSFNVRILWIIEGDIHAFYFVFFLSDQF